MPRQQASDDLWGVMAAAIASLLTALVFFAAIELAADAWANAKNPPCPEEAIAPSN